MALKIYVKDYKNIENIQKKIEKKYTGKRYDVINLLTKEGMYKIIGKKIVLYKLASNTIKSFELENISFLITENNWEKKEEIFNIPFHYYLLKRNIIEYTLSEKFKIVLEFIPGTYGDVSPKIFDFYFKTNILNILEIKKNLVTFLSLLK